MLEIVQLLTSAHSTDAHLLTHGRFSLAGEDIALDVAARAKDVIMSAKTWRKKEYEYEHGPFGPHNNMYRRQWPKKLHQDGTVEFEDGSRVEHVDVVMFCTGMLIT